MRRDAETTCSRPRRSRTSATALLLFLAGCVGDSRPPLEIPLSAGSHPWLVGARFDDAESIACLVDTASSFTVTGPWHECGAVETVVVRSRRTAEAVMACPDTIVRLHAAGSSETRTRVVRTALPALLEGDGVGAIVGLDVLTERRLLLRGEPCSSGVQRDETEHVLIARGGLWGVRAVVDGEPYELLLDTGFQGGVELAGEAADGMRRRVVVGHMTTSDFLDAADRAAIVVAERVEVLGACYEGLPIRLAQGAVDGGREWDGLLGTVILRRGNLTFDWDRRRVMAAPCRREQCWRLHG